MLTKQIFFLCFGQEKKANLNLRNFKEMQLMQIEMSFQAGVIISAGCHLVSSVAISIFLETA